MTTAAVIISHRFWFAVFTGLAGRVVIFKVPNEKASFCGSLNGERTHNQDSLNGLDEVEERLFSKLSGWC